MTIIKKRNQGTDKSNDKRTGYIGDFIKGDVKPERYEKPDTRPAPSPKPPSKKKGD